MATFTRVDEAPEKLNKNEFVINKPNFKEELDQTRKRRGTSGLTTASSLRDIFMAITDKYDKTLNPYGLKLTKYAGRAYSSDEDLVAIIYEIINAFNLDLINAAVDYSIKNRPAYTDTIYYVSKDDLLGSSAFLKNGINMLNLNKVKQKDLV